MHEHNTRGGVYIIYLSDATQKYFYVGRTSHFQSRWDTHLNKLKEGTHINQHMQNVYNKHQTFNPQIVKVLGTVEEQIVEEQKLIDKHFYDPFCVNACKSATGGGHSEETRKKMSETRKGMRHTPESIQKMKAQRLAMYSQMEHPALGRTWVHKNGEFGFVTEEELEVRLWQGWQIGKGEWVHGMLGKTHSEESKEKMKDSSNKGWSWVNNGEESKVVPPEEFQHYLENGWQEGMRENWVCLNKDGKNTRVREEEVQSYLEDGWLQGRVVSLSHTEEAKRRIAKGSKGTKWMYKIGAGNKRVKPTEIQNYLDQGWLYGKKDNSL